MVVGSGYTVSSPCASCTTALWPDKPPGRARERRVRRGEQDQEQEREQEQEQRAGARATATARPGACPWAPSPLRASGARGRSPSELAFGSVPSGLAPSGPLSSPPHPKAQSGASAISRTRTAPPWPGVTGPIPGIWRRSPTSWNLTDFCPFFDDPPGTLGADPGQGTPDPRRWPGLRSTRPWKSSWAARGWPDAGSSWSAPSQAEATGLRTRSPERLVENHGHSSEEQDEPEMSARDHHPRLTSVGHGGRLRGKVSFVVAFSRTR